MKSRFYCPHFCLFHAVKPSLNEISCFHLQTPLFFPTNRRNNPTGGAKLPMTLRHFARCSI